MPQDESLSKVRDALRDKAEKGKPHKQMGGLSKLRDRLAELRDSLKSERPLSRQTADPLATEAVTQTLKSERHSLRTERLAPNVSQK